MKRKEELQREDPMEQELLHTLDQTAREYEKRDFAELAARIEAEELQTAKKPKWGGMKPLLTAACLVLLLAAVFGTTRFWNREVPVSDGTSENSETGLDQPYYDLWQALRKIGESNERQSEEYSTADYHVEDAAPMDGGEIKSETFSTAATGADTGTRYGETNVQVQGVDEADIVKNDGEYLYILSDDYEGGKLLSIVHAETMTLRYQQPFDGENNFYVNEMYVTGDTLVLVGSGVKSDPEDGSEESSAAYSDRDSRIAPLIYHMDTGTSFAKVFRLTEDRTGCALLRYHEQSGYYTSSRMVGGTLYLVSSQYFMIAQAIEYDAVESYLPTVRDTADGAYTTLPADCIDLTADPRDQYTQVSAIPITEDGETVTRSVLGSSGDTVYSSTENLYLMAYGANGLQAMKFALQPGGIAEPVTGTVPGDMLNNQFSMDEYGGYYRVVTTKWTEDGQTNHLYVLDENLEVVGESAELAPGETVYAVRFMGDMAYVVTFMQVDPLFAIDLSDPRNPQIKGQLKIPGFSTYMHPVDENTLIGVGYDADEETGMSGGLKISLFDVSDPLDPKETDKLVANGNVSSGATYDHKAFTYLADRNLLIMPVSVYGMAELGGKALTTDLSGGALILQVTEDGIHFRGTVADPKVREEEYFNTRDIQRTTYIGNTLYTVSARSVMAVNLDTLAFENQLDLFDTVFKAEDYQVEPVLPDEEIEPFVIYD